MSETVLYKSYDKCYNTVAGQFTVILFIPVKNCCCDTLVQFSEITPFCVPAPNLYQLGFYNVKVVKFIFPDICVHGANIYFIQIYDFY